MTQSDKIMTEKDLFTMQSADPAELEQVTGGLVLTDGPIYVVRMVELAGDSLR
jgi:hypothetical protein